MATLNITKMQMILYDNGYVQPIGEVLEGYDLDRFAEEFGPDFWETSLKVFPDMVVGWNDYNYIIRLNQGGYIYDYLALVEDDAETIEPYLIDVDNDE